MTKKQAEFVRYHYALEVLHTKIIIIMQMLFYLLGEEASFC
jgi:hypothetical protein